MNKPTADPAETLAGLVLRPADMPQDQDTLWRFARDAHESFMGERFPSRDAWRAKLMTRWRAEPSGLWLLCEPDGRPTGALHFTTNQYKGPMVGDWPTFTSSMWSSSGAAKASARRSWLLRCKGCGRSALTRRSCTFSTPTSRRFGCTSDWDGRPPWSASSPPVFASVA